MGPAGMFIEPAAQEYLCFAVESHAALLTQVQARTKDLDQIQLIDLDPKVCGLLRPSL